MSIWGFLGSNTQKQSLWNIASLSAPKILVSYFQGRMTRCPKISSPDVKFWESYFKKVFFENLEITFWDSLKKHRLKSKGALMVNFRFDPVWLDYFLYIVPLAVSYFFQYSP